MQILVVDRVDVVDRVERRGRVARPSQLLLKRRELLERRRVAAAELLVVDEHRHRARLVAFGALDLGEELVRVGVLDVLGIQAAHRFAFLERRIRLAAR